MSGSKKKPKLIGIAGFKHSGKNTAAQAIPDRIEMAFADPVKRMLLTGLGLTHAQLYDQAFKEVPMPEYDGLTPRELMVSLGSGWGRQVLSDMWVRAVARQIEKARSEGCTIVVTDVRMENEAQMIRDQGGVILHLRRGPRENWWKRLARRFTKPDTEQYLKPRPGDVIIENDSDVKDLQWRVIQAMVRHPDQGITFV